MLVSAQPHIELSVSFVIIPAMMFLNCVFYYCYYQDLTSQVSAETDPVSLLPKVVSLLYIQVTLVLLFFPPHPHPVPLFTTYKIVCKGSPQSTTSPRKGHFCCYFPIEGMLSVGCFS